MCINNSSILYYILYKILPKVIETRIALYTKHFLNPLNKNCIKMFPNAPSIMIPIFCSKKVLDKPIPSLLCHQNTCTNTRGDAICDRSPPPCRSAQASIPALDPTLLLALSLCSTPQRKSVAVPAVQQRAC